MLQGTPSKGVFYAQLGPSPESNPQAFSLNVKASPGISTGPLNQRLSDGELIQGGVMVLWEMGKAFVHPFAGSFTYSFVPACMHS